MDHGLKLDYELNTNKPQFIYTTILNLNVKCTFTLKGRQFLCGKGIISYCKQMPTLQPQPKC